MSLHANKVYHGMRSHDALMTSIDLGKRSSGGEPCEASRLYYSRMADRHQVAYRDLVLALSVEG